MPKKSFDDNLQKKAQKEFQQFVFDLENARKEEVRKFNQELKNGWWFFAHFIYSEVLRRAKLGTLIKLDGSSV
ncbi:MAG: hypothetical protein KBT34_01710 [Prevotella sp.]|nr:hypothetical protein [Candidatus Prevotella equi]